MYTPEAQQFIFDHLVEIAAFLQSCAKPSGELAIEEYPITHIFLPNVSNKLGDISINQYNIYYF